MSEMLGTLESSSDTVMYAMDETSFSVESNNRYSWSPVGHPPVLEKNGSHAGLNAIGATELIKNFDSVIDVYSGDRSLTSIEVGAFLEYLLEINPGYKVIVLMDNAAIHNNEHVQEILDSNSERLSIINFPRYSPDMNPQENVWNWLKANLYKPTSRSSLVELAQDIYELYTELNSNYEQICSLTNARSFLV